MYQYIELINNNIKFKNINFNFYAILNLNVESN